jgi:hypothetical protein
MSQKSSVQDSLLPEGVKPGDRIVASTAGVAHLLVIVHTSCGKHAEWLTRTTAKYAKYFCKGCFGKDIPKQMRVPLLLRLTQWRSLS